MSVTHWSDYYHGNDPVTLTGAAAFKATEGLTFKDKAYAAHLELAAQGGHHAYAYHAFHTGDPFGQMRLFHSVVGDRPAYLDVEIWPAQAGSPAGIATLTEVVEAIDHYRSNLGGVMNVIYLPRSMWQRMGSPSLAALGQRGIAIINADYRQGSEDPSHPAWDSYGGQPVWSVQWKPCHDVTNSTWAAAQSVFETGRHQYVHPAASRTLTLRTPAMQGHDVGVVQRLTMVNATQYDDKYGPITVESVKTWQAKHHITADGKFGPVSWRTAGYTYTG